MGRTGAFFPRAARPVRRSIRHRSAGRSDADLYGLPSVLERTGAGRCDRGRRRLYGRVDVHGQRIFPGAVHQRALSGKRSRTAGRTDGIPRRTVRRCNGRSGPVRQGLRRSADHDLVGREHRRHGRSGRHLRRSFRGGRLQPQRLLPERRAAGGLLPDGERSRRIRIPAPLPFGLPDRQPDGPEMLRPGLPRRQHRTPLPGDQPQRRPARNVSRRMELPADRLRPRRSEHIPVYPRTRNGRNNLHRENLFVAEHPDRTANRYPIPGYGSSRAAPTCRSPGTGRCTTAMSPKPDKSTSN